MKRIPEKCDFYDGEHGDDVMMAVISVYFLSDCLKCLFHHRSRLRLGLGSFARNKTLWKFRKTFFEKLLDNDPKKIAINYKLDVFVESFNRNLVKWKETRTSFFVFFLVILAWMKSEFQFQLFIFHILNSTDFVTKKLSFFPSRCFNYISDFRI